MTRPDSRLSRLRRSLARAIDTMPPPGEAWCIDCRISGRRTVVVSAAGVSEHLTAHMDAGDRDGVQMYFQAADVAL